MHAASLCRGMAIQLCLVATASIWLPAAAHGGCEIGSIISSERRVKLSASTANLSCQSTSQDQSYFEPGPWAKAMVFATVCPAMPWSIDASSTQDSMVGPDGLVCSITLSKTQSGVGPTIQGSWCTVALHLDAPRLLHLCGSAASVTPSTSVTGLFQVRSLGQQIAVFSQSVTRTQSIEWDSVLELGPGDWEFHVAGTQGQVVLPGGMSTTGLLLDVSVTLAGSSPDIDDDGAVNGSDLGLLLAGWGGAAPDLTCDGTVDGADLGLLLAAWNSGP